MIFVVIDIQSGRTVICFGLDWLRPTGELTFLGSLLNDLEFAAQDQFRPALVFRRKFSFYRKLVSLKSY